MINIQAVLRTKGCSVLDVFTVCDSVAFINRQRGPLPLTGMPLAGPPIAPA